MKMKREQTQAWIIDIQERLLPAMSQPEELVRQAEKLIRGLNLLEIPLTVSQQYTRGLGMTASRIREAVGREDYLEKLSFSCLGEPAMRERLAAFPERKTVVLLGIESHICVLQTALDLKEAGYEPVVAADCVDSRKARDREMALRRMEQEGIRLATVESCLFELLGRAGTDTFRQISRLIK